MLRNITAIERDGFEVRTLTAIFEVPEESFDLLGAICRAATDYCKTEEGQAIYEYNCSNFNLADVVMSLPNDFCRKYGFCKIDDIPADIIVGWDDQFVYENELDGGHDDADRHLLNGDVMQ